MCTAQHYLLSMCIVQLLTIIERQIFDFLGYMWAPILANFFHMIFVIFGIFGSYLFRSNYIITYLLWSVFWCGWNIFLICFYSNVGILNRDSDVLNLGTGSVSWFEINGFGCKPTYPTNITSEDPFRLVRPEYVEDCFLDYPTVEIIHSAIQLILAICGLTGAIRIAVLIYRGTDGTPPKSAQRPSLYSIEFSPPVDAILEYDNIRTGGTTDLSPKPMTPRRVKRRSVMTRGTTGRQSGTSRRSHSSNRNSTRTSRRKFQQNPVTALIDHPRTEPARSDNHALTESNLKYLNTDIVPSVVNKSFRKSSNFIQNIAPDPIYYNMSNSTTFFEPSWNSTSHLASSSEQSIPQRPPHNHQGHYNPTYQHSTPNLNNNPEMVDEVYNNRPPSVRSSYSNFHGSRPLSMGGTTTENVFVRLNANQAAGGQGHHHHQHHHTGNGTMNSRSAPQAIPQVPHRQRSDSRESVRSMAFLNNGPPAYNLNYHTPPDSNSETTM